jgi:eukaryotic-like serine/threonine-protein kinase
LNPDLLPQLQPALGGDYRVEQELGAGVNVDRFHRETQLAASLQHPHIVPLLTAGAAGDLLYYTMPFIEEESLRARLAGAGAAGP